MIIVGGGPTGAMLASELRLHDVDVVVLERDAEPSRAALLSRHDGLVAGVGDKLSDLERWFADPTLQLTGSTSL